MMNDSPWAKRLTVRFPRTPRESRGGRFGGFRPGTSTPQTRLVIQWQSAQPIRQAMVRGRIEQGGTVDPEAQAFLDQSSPGYVVVVTGLPGQFGRLTPEALIGGSTAGEKGEVANRSGAGPATEGWARRRDRLHLPQGRCHRTGRQGGRVHHESRGRHDQEEVHARRHGLQRPARGVSRPTPHRDPCVAACAAAFSSARAPARIPSMLWRPSWHAYSNSVKSFRRIGC